MRDILISTTVIAAFIGGVVALFAPCCISVMLPAYFANTFRRRTALLGMTFVFGLGVATIILPIAFGASALTQFILGRHTAVFLMGATMMVAIGVTMVLGWKLPIPMPGMRAQQGRGPGSIFVLGAFSGAASACCAPVLAGVIALSSAAGSFLAAAVIGTSYVFGMIAPLFVIALFWDRYDWGNSRLIKGRTLDLRILGRTRSVHSTSLIGGMLLVVMGGLTALLGLTGVAMPRDGWQAGLSADLQHYGDVLLKWLGAAPGWFTASLVVGSLAFLIRRAIRDHLDAVDDPDGHGAEAEATPDQDEDDLVPSQGAP